MILINGKWKADRHMLLWKVSMLHKCNYFYMKSWLQKYPPTFSLRQSVCVCYSIPHTKTYILNPYIMFHCFVLKWAYRSRWCGPSHSAAPSQSRHCCPGTIHTAHPQSYTTILAKKTKRLIKALRYFSEKYESTANSFHLPVLEYGK